MELGECTTAGQLSSPRIWETEPRVKWKSRVEEARGKGNDAREMTPGAELGRCRRRPQGSLRNAVLTGAVIQTSRGELLYILLP